MKIAKKIVVIGGGTGSFVLLAGLKKYQHDLTAIVTVSDSGGSTGRLRSEFGFLPVGDIRQCLAALASENKHDYIRRLLLYRFDKGLGLSGHNLGNLILTALTDMSGSEPKAIEIASRIFRLQGKVIPVSLNKVDLVATYSDGIKIIGEHNIDEPKIEHDRKIIKLSTLKPAYIYSQAKEAIEKADLIVLPPGDIYTSLLPNFIVKGVKKAMQKTRAKLAYIINLMTRYSQTNGFSASDHVAVVEKYIGRKIDVILINKTPISLKVKNLYFKEKGFIVKDDLDDDKRTIKGDFLKNTLVKKPKGDKLMRSLVRHDSEKVAKALVKLLE